MEEKKNPVKIAIVILVLLFFAALVIKPEIISLKGIMVVLALALLLWAAASFQTKQILRPLYVARYGTNRDDSKERFGLWASTIIVFVLIALWILYWVFTS